MGVPLVLIHFRLGFSRINHPLIGVPPFMEIPIYIYNRKMSLKTLIDGLGLLEPSSGCFWCSEAYA